MDFAYYNDFLPSLSYEGSRSQHQGASLRNGRSRAVESHTLRFIKASLVYLAIGCTLGVLFILQPVYAIQWRMLHTHFNLLGWVSMMIFGVAYHILPRFRGRPLYSKNLAILHFWLANVGLVGMAICWSVVSSGGAVIYRSLAALFSLLVVAAILVFVWNLWATVR
ncbi:MAG: cbb3-type cytochrome c oxidase subunit I [Candidatus Tectomicrobia bacterium]|uniref:Cbb3-type cytochrome c oxidase subunit I n=1 Tax=Tectimicrobiota bacterium TaxID=2528274 RepID=A0A932CR07_UNCTE|nr:cbb3-type cytochrome c oxidase subunit I [Candidatus Tectomicrobia bacterium]